MGHFTGSGTAPLRSTPCAHCNPQRKLNLESGGRKVAHRCALLLVERRILVNRKDTGFWGRANGKVAHIFQTIFESISIAPLCDTRRFSERSSVRSTSRSITLLRLFLRPQPRSALVAALPRCAVSQVSGMGGDMGEGGGLQIDKRKFPTGNLESATPPRASNQRRSNLLSSPLPIENRRYSRLKICAT